MQKIDGLLRPFLVGMAEGQKKTRHGLAASASLEARPEAGRHLALMPEAKAKAKGQRPKEPAKSRY